MTGTPGATAPAATDPPAAGAAGFGPPPAGTAGYGPAAVGINFRRLGIGDLITGGATLLLLISLFLPWYTVSSPGIDGEGAFSASVSALGSGAGGWRFLILLVCLVTLGYLFARTLWPEPHLPLPHWQVLGIATAFNFVLTLVAFVVKPGDSGGIVGEITGISISWGFGAFVGLLFAIAAVVGAFVRASDPEVIATTGPGTTAPAPMGQYQPLAPARVPIQHPPAPQPRQCTGCRAPLRSGDQFCATCGTPT